MRDVCSGVNRECPISRGSQAIKIATTRRDAGITDYVSGHVALPFLSVAEQPWALASLGGPTCYVPSFVRESRMQTIGAAAAAAAAAAGPLT